MVKRREDDGTIDDVQGFWSDNRLVWFVAVCLPIAAVAAGHVKAAGQPFTFADAPAAAAPNARPFSPLSLVADLLERASVRRHLEQVGGNIFAQTAANTLVINIPSTGRIVGKGFVWIGHKDGWSPARFAPVHSIFATMSLL